MAEKRVERVRWWEEFTRGNCEEMDNNPAPGNRAGGLTTILEKAFGSGAKSGGTNSVDVYHYAESVRRNGFVCIDSPGDDPASVTGQVASGGVVHDFLFYPVDAANRYARGLPVCVSAFAGVSPSYGGLDRLHAWVSHDNGCIATLESSREGVFGQRLIVTGSDAELAAPQAWTIPDDGEILRRRSAGFIRRITERIVFRPRDEHDGRLIGPPVFRRQMQGLLDFGRCVAFRSFALPTPYSSAIYPILHRSP